VIGEMPASPQIAAKAPHQSQAQRNNFVIGLSLGPLTEARRQLLKIAPNTRGVIVLSIDDDSALLGLGLRPRDVIESINQQPVTSPVEVTARLKQVLASDAKNVLMLINRHGTSRYLAMSRGCGRGSSPRGGHIPYTVEAEHALAARGVVVLPDFISNAGGVICAAVEYRGGTETAALALIDEQIRANTEAVLDEARRSGALRRTAAMSLAAERVRRAMRTRRWDDGPA
jgi:membrane-associated protease RseP (regulator of RpoE activity)